MLALFKRNILLKRTTIGASISEILVPVVSFLLVFFLLSSLGFRWKTPDFETSTDLFYGDPKTAYDHSRILVSDVRVIFVPTAAENLLVKTTQALLESTRGQDEIKWTEFKTYKDAEKSLKTKKGWESPLIVQVEEIPKQIYSTITPDEITKMTAVPEYRYTIHSVGWDMSTRTGGDHPFRVDSPIPLQSRSTSRSISMQSLLNEAILRINGLYDGDLTLDPKSENAIFLQHRFFPNFPYYDDGSLRPFLVAVATVSSLSFLPSVFLFIASLVLEKETFIRPTLIMMGASKYALYFSWYIFQWLFLFPVVVICSIIVVFVAKTNLPFWTVLLPLSLYILTLIAFLGFLSAFFTKVKPAQITAILIFLLLSGLGLGTPFLPFDMAKWLSVFSLQSLFATVFNVLLDADRAVFAREGLLYDELHHPTSGLFGILPSCGLFLIQTALFFLLTIYVDNIMPGEYSNPLPFYYPLVPTYWGCGPCSRTDPSSQHQDQDSLLDSSSTMTPSYSPDANSFIQPILPQDKKNVAVKIRGLVKTFQNADGGDFNAVDGLDLDLMRNSMTVSLGHNGSGKSTTINMLTGLYPPTSGTIQMFDRYGLPIDPHNSRGQIGVCPQYNSLYPNLTVGQHLRLFSAVKQNAMGKTITKAELDREIDSLLLTLKLGPDADDKAHSQIHTLSGGQKRKVCLALALLHKPSILILDEPCSGVDVSIAKTQIWSILDRIKTDAAVLMTTHSLEEAEIGDKIGIMVKGQLQCFGSSLFLKQKFGVGYSVILEKTKVPGVFDRITDIDNSINGDLANKSFGGAHGAEITTLSGQKLLRTFLPHYTQAGIFPLSPQQLSQIHTLTPEQEKLCSVMQLRNDNQSSLTFTVPYSQGDSIPDILNLIDSIKSQCAIADTSLSVTTLEDVFIRANDGSVPSAQTSAQAWADSEQNSDHVETISSLQSPNPDGIQLNTTLWDRERVQKDGPVLFWIQFRALLWKRALLQMRDIPSLCRTFLIPIILCLLTLGISHVSITSPVRTVDYNNFSQLNHPLYYSHLTPPDYVPQDQHTFWDQGNTFTKQFGQFPSSNALPPTTDWSEHVKLFKDPYEGTEDIRFDFTSFAQRTYKEMFSSARSTARVTSPVALFANLDRQHFNLKAYLYSNNTNYYTRTAYLSRFYETVAETAFTTAKPVLDKFGSVLKINAQMHTLDDESLREATKVVGVAIILISCLLYPTTIINSLVKERNERVVHLHRISGVSQLAFWSAYGLFDFLIYLAMCIIMIGTMAIARITLPPASILYLSLTIYGIVSILFVYSFSLFFKSPASAQAILSITIILGPFLLYLLMTIIAIIFRVESFYQIYWVTLIIPSSGLIWPLLQGTRNQYNSYLTFMMIKWLAVIPIYLAILWGAIGITDKHWFEEFFAKPKPIQKRDLADVDPDVLAEEELIKSPDLDKTQYPLISMGLRKVFGKHTAVNNIFFRINKGEKFALLGANGAGKSTTIAMLTSDYISSQSIESQQDPTNVQHTAFISSFDIIKNNQDCWKELGFCPQFDALNLSLTARETLTLYCHLRGEVEDTEFFVTDLLNALGIEYAADRKLAGLSLGMRRRLSIGVALVGNPGIVLLDEASTGVDPISRANIRLLLQQTCKNRALLLTSHNFEEVEALADNIGIMSRGQMKVIGSKNELKRKLTNHWQLNLQIQHGRELETTTRVLSALTDVPISFRLDQLLQQVTASNLSASQDSASFSKPVFSEANNIVSNITTPAQLTHDPDYVSFVDLCRATAPNNGTYILDCRSNTGIINVNKSTFTLAALFKKAKALQATNAAIETYSCSPVPLDQVFLNIVRKDEEHLAVLHARAKNGVLVDEDELSTGLYAPPQ